MDSDSCVEVAYSSGKAAGLSRQLIIQLMRPTQGVSVLCWIVRRVLRLGLVAAVFACGVIRSCSVVRSYAEVSMVVELMHPIGSVLVIRDFLVFRRKGRFRRISVAGRCFIF